jgi:molecular chaperone GrpE
MTVDEPVAAQEPAIDGPEVYEAGGDEPGRDGSGSDDSGNDDSGNGGFGSGEPGAGGPADLDARLAELTAALRAVQRTMADAGERAAARERIIDRLHEDNQRLRAGERQLVLRPVLTDLQRLRNDLLREAAALPDGIGADAVAALLRSYAHSVELTLERGGVETLHPAPGDVLDPARHRPQAVLPAPEPAADGTVAGVIADGYRETVTDRVLTPATVQVFRWNGRAPQTQEDTSA